MEIVVPMTGVGLRFARAGYRDLKPLIPVDGMPMIEHVVRMFPGEKDFLFICTDEALARTAMRSVLERIAPEGRIVAIPPHKLGPVHAVLEAGKHIRREQPVIVNYCDFSAEWDYADFRRTVAERNCAGAITAYRGFHPHSLGPNLYAYMREHDGHLLEIREKHCFTGDRMSEYASAGTYYFRNGGLLLDYFQKAVARGLSTNGEFYASSPYNLLVEDKLEVLIYELKRFLQWGTPEDLEEYQGWSRYFAEYSDWKPRLPAGGGTNLIPMAGSGVRFAGMGYRDPKPLVAVSGTPMVQRALQSLPPAKNWISICQSAHLRDPRFAPALRVNGFNCRITEAADLTQGQLCSCLLAREQADPEQPLLVAPCDAAFVYDTGRYAQLISNPENDCLVWTFRNHPHANRNPQQYGWLTLNADGSIQNVICKAHPGGAVQEAPGITGAFWFRKARFLWDAADQIIAQNRRVNGEFYVDSAVRALVEQGRRACIFPVRHYLCFGTPDDVRTYEYWESYFRGAPHHPYRGEAA